MIKVLEIWFLVRSSSFKWLSSVGSHSLFSVLSKTVGLHRPTQMTSFKCNHLLTESISKNSYILMY
jgi:hypothetical protein